MYKENLISFPRLDVSVFDEEILMVLQAMEEKVSHLNISPYPWLREEHMMRGLLI
jgi:hypothetical protein